MEKAGLKPFYLLEEGAETKATTRAVLPPVNTEPHRPRGQLEAVHMSLKPRTHQIKRSCSQLPWAISRVGR